MGMQELHRGRLLDHLQLVVADLAAARRFYQAILKTLDVPIGGEGEGFFWADELVVSSKDSPAAEGRLTGRAHFAFQAKSRDQVEAFHKAALAAGGRDNGGPMTLHGFPSSLDAFIRDTVIPGLTGGRPVDIIQVPSGDYAVRDVVFRIVPPPSLAALMALKVRKMVWAKAGLKDARAELGGLKLFILRQGGASERLLQNQDEVRAWFEARGYTAIDPGTLPIEEQIVLFSRATHIAGAEGAGFANLLFTVGAPEVLLVASPAVMNETFFPGLAKAMGLRLHMVAGVLDGENPTRAAHFALPIARLDAYERGTTDQPWLRRHDAS